MSEEKEMFEFLEDRGIFNYLYDEPTEPLNIKVRETNGQLPVAPENAYEQKAPKLNILWKTFIEICGELGFIEHPVYCVGSILIFIATMVAVITGLIGEGDLVTKIVLYFIGVLFCTISFFLSFGSKISVSKASQILRLNKKEYVYVITYYGVERAKLYSVDYNDDPKCDDVKNLKIRCELVDVKCKCKSKAWFTAQEIFQNKNDAVAAFSMQNEKRIAVLQSALNIDEERATKFIMSTTYYEYAKCDFFGGKSTIFSRCGIPLYDYLMREEDVFECLKYLSEKELVKQETAERQRKEREKASQMFEQLTNEEKNHKGE